MHVLNIGDFIPRVKYDDKLIKLLIIFLLYRLLKETYTYNLKMSVSAHQK